MKMKTTKYEIFSERLPGEFDGLTIAHVSDLHNCDLGTELTSALAAIKPDFIVITGDMIHVEGQSAAAEKFAVGAAGIAPTYYVAGNHERVLSCYGEFKNFLTSAGVHVLENDYEIITRGEGKIALLGMNDPTFFGGGKKEFVSELKRICGEITDADVNYIVLLSHRPELFEQYVSSGVDLSLCGHTHGGHVRVPLLGAIYAPGQGLFPKYSDGKFERDGKYMIISKGLGKSSWVPRFLNPPELVIERLFCRKREDSETETTENINSENEQNDIKEDKQTDIIDTKEAKEDKTFTEEIAENR